MSIDWEHLQSSLDCEKTREEVIQRVLEKLEGVGAHKRYMSPHQLRVGRFNVVEVEAMLSQLHAMERRLVQAEGPPCSACDTILRDRGACESCGFIVCQSCAEAPDGSCCGGH